MGNNKVRRQDQANSKPSSTTTTKDKHDPPLRPTRISTTAQRTLFDAYIQPLIAIPIAIVMNTYQLLFGMAIFVYGTLYEVIHRIWIPTAEPDLYTHTTKSQRRQNQKTKGRKGKTQHKAAAPRKIEPVKSLPPAPKSVASVASMNEDVVPASPTEIPAVQMSIRSPSPTPASEDDTAVKPDDSVSTTRPHLGSDFGRYLG
jgi:hypothetical protein